MVGQGTWRMGEDPRRRDAEERALRAGLDLGMTLIDTAEMYGDGGAEEVVGAAIAGRRDEVFLVSKVLPSNASRRGVAQAAERSLRRLRTDRIDLYLLHWPGPHPLEGTLEAFARLRSEGTIAHYGLSNFDAAGMDEAERLPHGPGIAVDQVYYNLRRRGIERTLLPWCRSRGVVVMAYTPLDGGGIRNDPAVRRVAERRRTSPAAVALAWTIRLDGVVTIPMSSNPAHAAENVAAAALALSPEDLDELDRAFSAPDREIPLETV